MVGEVTKKQRELDEVMDVFHGLRTFVLELRRSTKDKQFQVANAFAWESILACNRMLVIDLAAWVDSEGITERASSSIGRRSRPRVPGASSRIRAAASNPGCPFARRELVAITRKIVSIGRTTCILSRTSRFFQSHKGPWALEERHLHAEGARCSCMPSESSCVRYASSGVRYASSGVRRPGAPRTMRTFARTSGFVRAYGALVRFEDARLRSEDCLDPTSDARFPLKHCNRTTVRRNSYVRRRASSD
jgi:hypothetical protein